MKSRFALRSFARRRFLAIAAGFLASTVGAQKGPKARLPRLGVIVAGMSAADYKSGARGNWKLIEDGLRDRGWVEGRDLEIHVLSLEDDWSRARTAVQELIARPVDVLLPFGPALYEATLQTKSIPIVGAHSWNRDMGGWPPNVTGVNRAPGENLDSKKLSLLKAISPSISRVALVGDGRWEPMATQNEVMDAAKLGITLVVTPLKSINRPEPDLDEALRKGVQALLVYGTAEPQVPDGRGPIPEWALKNRIPAIHSRLSAAETGALMTFASDLDAMIRRLPYFIDRILRGASPRDLPIEDATSFELVINLRVAKAIGLEVPAALRLQASRVIE